MRLTPMIDSKDKLLLKVTPLSLNLFPPHLEPMSDTLIDTEVGILEPVTDSLIGPCLATIKMQLSVGQYAQAQQMTEYIFGVGIEQESQEECQKFFRSLYSLNEYHLSQGAIEIVENNLFQLSQVIEHFSPAKNSVARHYNEMAQLYFKYQYFQKAIQWFVIAFHYTDDSAVINSIEQGIEKSHCLLNCNLFLNRINWTPRRNNETAISIQQFLLIANTYLSIRCDEWHQELYQRESTKALLTRYLGKPDIEEASVLWGNLHQAEAEAEIEQVIAEVEQFAKQLLLHAQSSWACDAYGLIVRRLGVLCQQRPLRTDFTVLQLKLRETINHMAIIQQKSLESMPTGYLTLSADRIIFPIQSVTDHRRQLVYLRDEMTAKLLPSNVDILNEYSIAIKRILAEYIAQLIQFLGEPPCHFNLITVGSLARGDMGPYSDIEIALLLDTAWEEQSESSHGYFNQLIQSLVFYLEALADPWFYVPRYGKNFYRQALGLRIDGDVLENNGCLKAIMIGTPVGLATRVIASLTQESHALNSKLAFSLLFASSIYATNSALLNDFQMCLNQRLFIASEHSITPTEIAKTIALSGLEDNAREYHNARKKAATSCVIDVKKNYLAPLNHWCIYWSLYFGILAENEYTLERNPKIILEKLIHLGVLESNWGNALISRFTTVHYLRSHFQLLRKGQPDEVLKSHGVDVNNDVTNTPLLPERLLRKTRLNSEQLHFLSDLETHIVVCYEWSKLFMQAHHADGDAIYCNWQRQENLIQTQLQRIRTLNSLSSMEDFFKTHCNVASAIEPPVNFISEGLKIEFDNVIDRLLELEISQLEIFIDVLASQLGKSYKQYLYKRICEIEKTDSNTRILHVLTDLLQSHPDASGFRVCDASAQQQWQQTLDLLTSEFPKELMPTTVFIEMHTGVKLLREEFKPLLFNEHGLFLRSARYGIREVASIATETIKIHLKKKPEFPGLEFAAGSLTRRITGFGAPLTTLVKMKTPDAMSCPVLISETITGENLQDRLVALPSTMMEDMDEYSFSLAVLASLFVNHEDAQPANCILNPITTLNGEAKVRPVNIDNDHAFVLPMLREEKPKLMVKNILFCCPQMLMPINARARRHFLLLDPYKTLMSWLEDCEQIDWRYRQLFHGELFKEEHHVTVPILLREGLVQLVFQKWLRLREHLMTYPEATLLDLLRLAEPLLAKAYESKLKDTALTIERRFDALVRGEYDNAGSARKTNLTPTQYYQSALMEIPTVTDIEAMSKFTPTQAIVELNEAIIKTDDLQIIRAELLAGNYENFKHLPNVIQEQVINGRCDALGTPLLGPINPDVAYTPEVISNEQGRPLDKLSREVIFLDRIQQKNFFKGLALTDEFSELILAGLSELDDIQLQKILERHSNLKRLNISGCSKLTFNAFLIIAQRCEHLEVLIARNLTAQFPKKMLVNSAVIESNIVKRFLDYIFAAPASVTADADKNVIKLQFKSLRRMDISRGSFTDFEISALKLEEFRAEGCDFKHLFILSDADIHVIIPNTSIDNSFATKLSSGCPNLKRLNHISMKINLSQALSNQFTFFITGPDGTYSHEWAKRLDTGYWSKSYANDIALVVLHRYTVLGRMTDLWVGCSYQPDRYISLYIDYLKRSLGFILTYDIEMLQDDQEKEHLMLLFNKIHKVRHDNPPIVLVGLKIRESYTAEKLHEIETIHRPKGEAFAREIGAIGFFISSARTGENVKEPFDFLFQFCLKDVIELLSVFKENLVESAGSSGTHEVAAATLDPAIASAEASGDRPQMGRR